MKHTTQNEDGSFTTYDETEDGFFMVMFSKVVDKLTFNSVKKRTCPLCNEICASKEKTIDHILIKHKKEVRKEEARLAKGI